MTTSFSYICVYVRARNKKLVQRLVSSLQCGTKSTKNYLIKIIGHKLIRLPKSIFMRGKAPVCNFCSNQLACLANTHDVLLKPGDISNAKEHVF
jgi:hypothetical protein